jgi:hypothetical protein
MCVCIYIYIYVYIYIYIYRDRFPKDAAVEDPACATPTPDAEAKGKPEDLH